MTRQKACREHPKRRVKHATSGKFLVRESRYPRSIYEKEKEAILWNLCTRVSRSAACSTASGDGSLLPCGMASSPSGAARLSRIRWPSRSTISPIPSSSGISRNCEGRSFLPSTSSAQAVPVRTCPSQAVRKDYKVSEVACSINPSGYSMPCGVPQAAGIPVTSSGRMSPEPFPAIMDRTFAVCSRKSDRPAFQCLSLTSGQKPVWSNYQSARLPGASSTPSIGACPSVARASSLSQILEPRSDVPPKCYLSKRACSGILARAEKRTGRQLPPALRTALEKQAALP